MIKEITEAKIVRGTGDCCIAVSYRSKACPQVVRAAYFQANSPIEATRLTNFLQSQVVDYGE